MASAWDTARADIEGAFSTAWNGLTSVRWGDRPFDPPATGGWIEVDIGASGDIGMVMPSGNRVGGTLMVTVADWSGNGPGAVLRLVETARAALNSLIILPIVLAASGATVVSDSGATVTTGPGIGTVWFDAPGAPRTVPDTAMLRYQFLAPFAVSE